MLCYTFCIPVVKNVMISFKTKKTKKNGIKYQIA